MSLIKFIFFAITSEKIFILAQNFVQYTEPTTQNVIKDFSTKFKLDFKIGSLGGGQYIYIKGIGFDSIPSNNHVFFGNYPCIISDQGVQGLYLKCETTKSDIKTKLTNIQVQTDGKLVSSCNYDYSYDSDYTPYIYSILPRSNFAGAYSYWLANYFHQTTNKYYLEEMKIGQYFCNLINNLDYTDSWYMDNLHQTKCQIPLDIEAGRYQINLRTYLGSALQSSITQKNVYDNATYQAMIIPYINRISSKMISPNGQILEIYGKGFSNNISKINLNKDYNYSIISAQKDKIIAFIQNNISQANQNFYISGSGLQYNFYDLSKNPNVSFYSQCYPLRNDILQNKIIPLKSSYGSFIEPQNIRTDIKQYHGQFWNGMFYAPFNGTYRFYTTAQVCSQIWLNLNPNILNVSQMVMVAACDSNVPIQDYFYQKYYNFTIDQPDAYGNYYPGQIGIPLKLTAGNYYQIHVVHFNQGVSSSVIASVRISDNSKNKTFETNSIPEIHLIEVTSFPTNEVVVLEIYNSKANKILNGTYSLRFQYKTLFNKITRQIPPNINNDTLSSYFLLDLQYQTSIIRESLDKKGSLNNVSISGYRYTIKFLSYRTYQIIDPIFDDSNLEGQAVFEFKQITKPSTPITGTYQISINGIQIQDIKKNTTLNYNNNGFQLDVGINQLIKQLYGGRQVQTYIKRGYEDGLQLFIQYKGFSKDITLPIIKFDNYQLTGGNGTVTASVSVWSPRSSDILFEPIPSEMLFQYSTQPQLNVYVNGILGVCQPLACNLNTSAALTPTIILFNRINKIISLTLNYSSNLTFQKQDIIIYHAGQSCQINYALISNTSAEINCIISSLNLEGGYYYPSVLIKQIGYANLDPGVKADQINLIVNQLICNEALDFMGIQPINISEGTINISQSIQLNLSNQGGTISFKGSGFPLDPFKSSYIISLNNVNLSIISTSYNYTLVNIPPQSILKEYFILNFQVNNMSLSLNVSISYLPALQIQKITRNLSTINLVEFNIQGLFFGIDKTQVTVQLIKYESQPEEISRIFNLNISTIDDNNITVYDSGIHLGNYNFRIWRAYYGYSNFFNYNNEVNVTGCSTLNGSLMGGNSLTLTGNNFIVDETQVFIGEAQNKICDITFMNNLQIDCIIPIAYPEYKNDQTYQIYVILKSNIQATIRTQNCNFTYSNIFTPKINLPIGLNNIPQQSIGIYSNGFIYQNVSLWSPITKIKGPNHWKYNFYKQRDISWYAVQNISQYQVYTTGTIVNITTDQIQPYEILVGNITVQTVYKSSNIYQFKFPSLSQGQYQIRLRNLNKYTNIKSGYSTQSWIAQVDLSINNNSTYSTISRAGTILNITGSGFRRSLQIQIVWNSINIGNCIIQIFYNPDLIQCQTPYLMSQSTYFGVLFLQLTQYDSIQNTNTTIKSNPYYPSLSSITVTLNLQQDSLGVFQVNLTSNYLNLSLTGSPNILNIVNVTLRVLGNKIKYYSTIQKNLTTLIASFTSIPIGLYVIEAMNDTQNYVDWNQNNNILRIDGYASLQVASSQNSYAGTTLTINGLGFSDQYEQNVVTVCGFNCLVQSFNYSQIMCKTPIFFNNSTFLYQNKFNMASINIQQYFEITGNVQNQIQYLIDKNLQTSYQSAQDNCSFQFNIKTGYQLVLKYLRFSPPISSNSDSVYRTLVITYSLDQINYQNLMINRFDIHQGWNYVVPEDIIIGVKSINFTDPQGGSSTQCQVSEIDFIGIIISSQDVPLKQGVQCQVNLTINGNNNISVDGTVTYNISNSYIIQNVIPSFGTTLGGTNLTLYVNYDFQSNMDQVKVLIDKVECLILSQKNQEIQCQTGPKNTQDNTGLEVIINGQYVYVNTTFIYADLYTNVFAWNGGLWPQEGDTIFIPKGQVLIIDQSPPKLNAILVEGSLSFLDNPALPDLRLDLNYLIIREGNFQIGSEDQPFQRKLNITLYGDSNDEQLSLIGSKAIGCISCSLKIHGKQINNLYTFLINSSLAGSTQIFLKDNVDWQVGQEIVITSSSVNHNESERRIISKIINQNQIQFQNPLLYNHISITEIYGNYTFPMLVEVAVLNRNIIIQGDDTSIVSHYGGHLLIFGDSIAEIQNVQFIYMGQAGYIGRYPIHLKKYGEMIDSYIIGNSIHDSFSRCITLDGVLYTQIIKNVCYNSYGHMIALEQGIESKNIIKANLMIGAKSISNILLYDISVANYYITNPDNILINNRAAGSDYYSYFYNLDTNQDIQFNIVNNCPQGLPIGVFQNNTAHSNQISGLQINILAPRIYPCTQTYNSQYTNPYSINQGIESVFEGFYTWQNFQSGIIAQNLGDITFNNVYVADFGSSAITIHKSSLTSRGVIIQNTLLLAQSIGNPMNIIKQIFGLVTPRSNGYLAQGITFQNFITNHQIPIQTCALCDQIYSFRISGGKNYQFKNLNFNNSQNSYTIQFRFNYKDIIWDLDGSLSTFILNSSMNSSFIVPQKQYINGIQGCLNSSKQQLSICTNTPSQQIRDVHIIFNNNGDAFMMIQRQNQSTFQKDQLIMDSSDILDSYVITPMTNYQYNIYWSNPFSKLKIQQSQYWNDNDTSIILVFNFTIGSSQYVTLMDNGEKLIKVFPLQQYPLNTDNCTTGDFYIDLQMRQIYICLGGRGRILDGQSLQISSYPAIYFWNDSLVWASHNVPKSGENATILEGVQVYYNQNESGILQDLTVLGELIFNQTNSTLQVNRIIVEKTGKILAGTQNKPFNGTLNITLYGSQNDMPLQFNSQNSFSSKVIVVKGQIELYGTPPQTTWTRLSEFAHQGQNQIVVLEAQNWQIGDEIVLGPSGRNPDQFEKHTIAQILNNTIQLSEPLLYDHYGDLNITINNQIGDLDMRTAVGHITRNIKIIGAQDSTELGCSVLLTQTGSITKSIFNGVEWINCGQRNSQLAALEVRDFNNSLNTYVVNSVFRESLGIFINIVNSTNLLVENNVMYSGTKAMILIQNINRTKIKNNLFINVKKNISTDWAVFISHIDVQVISKLLYTNTFIQIFNNTGQGSDDSGYFFMASPCDRRNKVYTYNNTCSSVYSACFSFLQIDQYCSYVRGIKAYHANVGVMLAMNVDQTRIEYFLIAESTTGIIIKPGKNESDDNPNYANRIYVSALARPQCYSCYTQQKTCSNQVGFQLVSISSISYPPYSNLPSDNQNLINTTQRMDGRMYISNSIFQNFQLTQIYSCSQNYVFSPNIHATDSVSQHYLQTTQCIGCETNAYFKFINPASTCFYFECTGQENILVTDWDGSFFGSPGQAFSNNPYLTKNLSLLVGCIKKDSWNGYFCNGTSLTSLLWLSVAPDNNTRLFSPILLSFQEIQNQINSPFQWNQILSSQFNAIVMVNTMINMKNTGENPSDAHFWLSRRRNYYQGGSPNDYVIIQLQYNEPLSIVVSTYFQNQSQVIKPFIASRFAHVNLVQYRDICGANNYFQENNTIHFVVTGESRCYVRVRQANSIFFQINLNLSIEDFLSEGDRGSQKWIQITANLMNVSTDNIKIVKVTQNTTLQVQWTYEDQTPLGIDGVNGYNSTNITSNLNQIAQQAYAIANNSIWQSQFGYSIVVQDITVQQIETLNYQSPQPPQPQPEQEIQFTYDTNYGQSIGIILLILMILLQFLYY